MEDGTIRTDRKNAHLLSLRLDEADAARNAPDGIDRRAFLKAVGASLAAAGLAGCSGEPDQNALPYVEVPEGTVPGIARYYASAVTFEGYAQPILGRTFSGRPVKLEGNPDHPACEGATDLFTQAALMGLYDPARSQAPRRLGDPVTWKDAEAVLVRLGRQLDENEGAGFRIVTGQVSSPTLIRQIDALLKRWPNARWHMIAPFAPVRAAAATRAVYGRPLLLRPRLEKAQTLVLLDEDILGPGPFQTVYGEAFGAARRARREGDAPFRLLVAEPVPTPTGAMADKRHAVEPQVVMPILQAIGVALGLVEDSGQKLAGKAASFADQAIAALRHAGAASLLMVGERHGAEAQQLALRINEALGAMGSTLSLLEPEGAPMPEAANGITQLKDDLERGAAQDLLLVNVDPVYTESGGDFASLLKSARLTIHAGLYEDATARTCDWHLPLQHDLESWSDARAFDGTVSIIQPLVKPFFDVRSIHSVLAMLAGRFASDHEIVQETWKPEWGAAFGERWRDVLLKGFVDGSASQPVRPTALPAAPVRRAETAPFNGFTLAVHPDPSIWDGSLSENAWAQETPKPMNKMTWGTLLTVSPATASELGLKNGDGVAVHIENRAQSALVWVQPGQADKTLGLTTGYGRKTGEGAETTLGANAFLLMGSSGKRLVEGVAIEKTGEHVDLPTTQPHQAMDGRDFARTAPLTQAGQMRDAQPRVTEAPPSFYPDRPLDGPQWGMSIDLDICIGCNACVVACVAENNVPMVGRELVAEGREMHWLRVDHYHDGNVEDPEFHFQPVPCMHCEQAPCEMGCPVNAAVHSRDGLNLQVYNRCIGTRTCSSFCPYKVRRFNWFDFTSDDPETLQAMRNPDVTVRMRGVMEKCTYCVQRIEETRISAQKEGRPIRDGEVRTACQQACPTQAITFGDVADPSTAVSRKKREERNYLLLEEVNTRPRTSYLARLIEDEPKSGETG